MADTSSTPKFGDEIDFDFDFGFDLDIESKLPDTSGGDTSSVQKLGENLDFDFDFESSLPNIDPVGSGSGSDDPVLDKIVMDLDAKEQNEAAAENAAAREAPTLPSSAELTKQQNLLRPDEISAPNGGGPSSSSLENVLLASPDDSLFMGSSPDPALLGPQVAGSAGTQDHCNPADTLNDPSVLSPPPPDPSLFNPTPLDPSFIDPALFDSSPIEPPPIDPALLGPSLTNAPPANPMLARGTRPALQSNPYAVPNASPSVSQSMVNCTPALANRAQPRQFPWRLASLHHKLEHRQARTTYQKLTDIAENPKLFSTLDGALGAGVVYSPTTLRDKLLEKKRCLTLRIQNMPAIIPERQRGPNISFCRFGPCVVPNREITPGQFRVAFDEFSTRIDRSSLDPYVHTGYVHLYCMERFMHLPSICRTFRVLIEGSERLPHEPDDGLNLFNLGPRPLIAEAEAFVNVSKTMWAPPGYPNVNGPDGWHYEGTLSHRLGALIWLKMDHWIAARMQPFLGDLELLHGPRSPPPRAKKRARAPRKEKERKRRARRDSTDSSSEDDREDYVVFSAPPRRRWQQQQQKQKQNLPKAVMQGLETQTLPAPPPPAEPAPPPAPPAPSKTAGGSSSNVRTIMPPKPYNLRTPSWLTYQKQGLQSRMGMAKSNGARSSSPRPRRSGRGRRSPSPAMEISSGSESDDSGSESEPEPRSTSVDSIVGAVKARSRKKVNYRE